MKFSVFTVRRGSSAAALNDVTVWRRFWKFTASGRVFGTATKQANPFEHGPEWNRPAEDVHKCMKATLHKTHDNVAKQIRQQLALNFRLQTG